MRAPLRWSEKRAEGLVCGVGLLVVRGGFGDGLGLGIQDGVVERVFARSVLVAPLVDLLETARVIA